MSLGILLLIQVRRIRINLAGCLVLCKVELFPDLTLAAGQLLIALLALEVRADFGFQFFRPLGGVSLRCLQSAILNFAGGAAIRFTGAVAFANHHRIIS